MRIALLLLPTAALLGGCATAPVPLAGEFAVLTPAQSVADSRSGERVRWGGEIIKVDPRADSTCFEILSRELDGRARPLARDHSDGRFIACRAGFYDPEVFVRGRDITIVGNVTGSEKGRVGEFDYTYARVAAEAVYLWPKRPLVVEQRHNGWGPDPFWGPGYGPYWGGGFWGPPPVIIVKPRPTSKP
jgi:outer membrane lipoprotein